MKAKRYIRPDRPLEQPSDPSTMNDQNNFPAMPGPEPDFPQDMPQALEVDVGRAMPPAMAENIPMLQSQDGDQPPIDATDAAASGVL